MHTELSELSVCISTATMAFCYFPVSLANTNKTDTLT